MKTIATNRNVSDFIANLDHPQRRADSIELVRMMESASNQKATMWGSSIVGFGRHRYRYSNGNIGEICAIGFSPRSRALSLYVSTEFEGGNDLMSALGKYKQGNGGCIYINKLEDIDLKVLKKILIESYQHKAKTSIRSDG